MLVGLLYKKKKLDPFNKILHFFISSNLNSFLIKEVLLLKIVISCAKQNLLAFW